MRSCKLLNNITVAVRHVTGTRAYQNERKENNGEGQGRYKGRTDMGSVQTKNCGAAADAAGFGPPLYLLFRLFYIGIYFFGP